MVSLYKLFQRSSYTLIMVQIDPETIFQSFSFYIQDLFYTVIIRTIALTAWQLGKPKSMFGFSAIFILFRISMKTVKRLKQIRGQLTKSPDCGAHQSISFPGSRSYCYGDVCRGTLKAQSGQHAAHSEPRQTSSMSASKETCF